MKTGQLVSFLGGVLDGACTAVPILLWSETGLGKSSIVHQVAAEHGLLVEELRLATQETGDLIGLPRSQRTVDGQGNERHETVWDPPSWFPFDLESRGVLFLDECNRAPREIRAGIFSLLDTNLDRRHLHTHEFPPGWHIIAAGNPPSDREQTDELATAFLARFAQFYVEWDVASWVEWFKSQASFHEILMQWVACGGLKNYGVRKHALEVLPNPRAVELLSILLSKNLVPAGHLHEIASGLLGSEAADELVLLVETYRLQVVQGAEILASYPSVRARFQSQSLEDATATAHNLLETFPTRSLSDIELENLRLCLEDATSEHRSLIISTLNKRKDGERMFQEIRRKSEQLGKWACETFPAGGARVS